MSGSISTPNQYNRALRKEIGIVLGIKVLALVAIKLMFFSDKPPNEAEAMPANRDAVQLESHLFGWDRQESAND